MIADLTLRFLYIILMLKLLNIASAILSMEAHMPFGLKSIWFQLATEVAVIAWFLLRFSNAHATGAFDGPDGLIVLGKTVLWFIAATIVAMIAAHIVGVIVLAIAEGGKEPDTTTDERDRAIELRGDRVSNSVGGAGFLGGILLMTFGYAIPVVIATMFVGCLFGAIVGNIFKLRSYAEG